MKNTTNATNAKSIFLNLFMGQQHLKQGKHECLHYNTLKIFSVLHLYHVALDPSSISYTTYERKVNGFFDIDRHVGVVSP